MNAVRSALSYFSILPAGVASPPRAGMLAALPLVGVALGALAGTAGWLATRVLPEPLPMVAAFAATIVLSGALHLDGFLDAADALFASVSVERRLEILKDPRHGTFALAALAIAVPAWLAAIAAIPAAAWPWTFAYCGGVARAAAALNAYRFPYAGARPPVALLAAATAVALACCLPQPQLAWGAPVAAGLALVLGGWCARRLGGVLNGDCYGALIVVLEIALLWSAAGALSGHRP